MGGDVLGKLKVPMEGVFALLMVHSVQIGGWSRARCFRSFHRLSPSSPTSLQGTEVPGPRTQRPRVLWALTCPHPPPAPTPLSPSVCRTAVGGNPVPATRSRAEWSPILQQEMTRVS